MSTRIIEKTDEDVLMDRTILTHIDGNKRNNDPDNLRWDSFTDVYNTINGFKRNSGIVAMTWRSK